MKTYFPRWLRGGLVLLALAASAGCDDGGGGDGGGAYDGTWQGRTSHGGTVVFAVDGSSVRSLEIVDARARVRIVEPVAIEGTSFSAENSEGVSGPGSPAVSLQAVFDSDARCTGTYSLRTSSESWSGTFEAIRP